MRVVGVDVGARRMHAVALDSRGAVVGVGAFDAVRLAELVTWAAGAAQVAVDAPDRWSTAPHGADQDLSPKFRTARCGEIALGREHRIWVPWVTPIEPAPGWISAGIELFAALRAAGHDPVEVYPHAAFRVLGGGRRPPPKQTRTGAERRVRLLEEAGVRAARLPGGSHDAIDAAAAALVGLHRARGTARSATCGHDGSAIWLPGAAAPSAP